MSDDLVKEISQNVRDIKSEVLTLVKQGAIHNQILAEHEKRSTQLEIRLDPIENDYKFRHKLFMLILGSGGLLGYLIALLK